MESFGRRVTDAISGKVIRIALLNIRSGQARVLKVSLHSLQQGNMGISITQEMNMIEGLYTRKIAG